MNTISGYENDASEDACTKKAGLVILIHIITIVQKE